MKRPLLSVLMPVYNAEKFLLEAVESILNQTFKDFELVIVDDGSTDSSVDIVRSFSDPRIRLYKNEKNLGISATLNRGIDLAEADLIARMDADDICYPERLQRQYDFIQSHPDGSLYSCWAMEVDEKRMPIKTEHLNPNHYYYNLTFACWIYHPTMVYRRKDILSIGGYSLTYSEDFDLAWRLSRRFKMYHLPEVLLEYRHSGHSLWKVTHKNENHESFLRQVRRNINYYLNNQDIQIWDWQLELLSYSYDPFRKCQYSVSQVCDCLRLLKTVSQKILIKENINRDPEAILAATKEKWQYTLLLYSHKLGYYKGMILLIKTNSWNLIFRIFAGRFKKFLNFGFAGL